MGTVWPLLCVHIYPPYNWAFPLVCMCVYPPVCVGMYMGVRMPSKTRGIGFLPFGLTGCYELPDTSELRPSARAVCALDCWAVSPAVHLSLYSFLCGAPSTAFAPFAQLVKHNHHWNSSCWAKGIALKLVPEDLELQYYNPATKGTVSLCVFFLKYLLIVHLCCGSCTCSNTCVEVRGQRQLCCHTSYPMSFSNQCQVTSLGG